MGRVAEVEDAAAVEHGQREAGSPAACACTRGTAAHGVISGRAGAGKFPPKNVVEIFVIFWHIFLKAKISGNEYCILESGSNTTSIPPFR